MPRSKGRNSGRGSLILLVPIVAFIIIIAVMLLMWHQPTGSGGTPFYLSTERVAGVSFTGDEWRSIYSEISLKTPLNDSIRIIFFGSTTCPHCHRQSEFFNATMPGKVLYLWVDVDQDAGSVFSKVVNLEVSKGIPFNYAGGVPHMLVLGSGGELKAIVVGEALDQGFWSMLLSG
ncbi:thioredoxin family protein [Desulfurococcus mucosus]|uniref:thioredoxin family protein n=1 Tax=Desulfurococcus mucosus TaxID=2275 RepID=UPI0009FC40C0|nr:thioredoxin family protein [Desulfurococcus mucosus]